MKVQYRFYNDFDIVQFWFRDLLQKNRDDYLLINNQKETHVRLSYRAVIPSIIARVKFKRVWRNVIKKGLKANKPIKMVHIWLVCSKLYFGEAQYKILTLEGETSVKSLGIWVDDIYFWSDGFQNKFNNRIVRYISSIDTLTIRYISYRYFETVWCPTFRLIQAQTIDAMHQ